jgi:hypothetical protein
VAVESSVIKPFYLGKKTLEWSQDIPAIVSLALLFNGEDTMESRSLSKTISNFT